MLAARLSETQPAYLIGYQDDKLEILQPESILRIFADQQRVFAQTESGTFRALLGFPMGVFVGYTVTVFLSLFIGPGNYRSAEPNLITRMGGEMPAVVAQYFLCGALGAGFAVGTLIWEMESWSIARRTISHLLLVSLLMFPAAYLMHWMPHNLAGVAMYILIFTGIYAMIWAGQYLAWMRRVQAINRRLRLK